MKNCSDTAFNAYDRANPLIWQLFCKFTFEAVGAGRAQVGKLRILKRIRWEVTVKRGAQVHKKFAANYARKFVQAFPAHDGIFYGRLIFNDKIDGGAQ